MPYTITILKPVYSKSGAQTSSTGRTYDMEPVSEKTAATLYDAIEVAEEYIDTSQDALGEEEGAHRYYEPARRSALAMSPDGSRIELPDGCVIEVVRS